MNALKRYLARKRYESLCAFYANIAAEVEPIRARIRTLWDFENRG